MLENAKFIEYPEAFHYEYRSVEPSPIFRKNFFVNNTPESAKIAVCGLGYGYYYLNGEPITNDLFTAPNSDYNKTLWYNVYDITDKISQGENLLAVILGNGFYNETLSTVWGNNTASWRDLPKFCLELVIEYKDSTQRIVSDNSWISSKCSPVLFNQLRSGETYDANIGESWRQSDFCDDGWINARISEKAPTGVLRRCECEPIIKDTEYRYINAFKNTAGNWVLDYGQNISGFVRVSFSGKKGSQLLLRHTERLKPDGTCEFNEMDSEIFYKNGDFQVDRVILADGVTNYEPRFTYHGFRYLEIEGLEEKPEKEDFVAIFVHQDIAPISTFSCSDDTLNRLFNMNKITCLSNLFYIPTDCPTREKFGWTNDAQASCEQMLQNFDIYKLFRKWLQDIFDSIRSDGALPSIIPTHSWGYDSWSGPICTGIIFELPYQMYRYSDNEEPILTAYPYMLKHLEYINSKKDINDGLIGYGLCDWAGPFPSSNHAPTPVKLSDTLLAIKFHRITAFAAQICGDFEAVGRLNESEKMLISAFKKAYMTADGECRVSEQTALSMIIALGIYENLEPLKAQLIKEIEKYNYHHHCGMLGLQYLFKALDICGISDFGVRMITADGHPSYKQWITDGATTMYERWGDRDSNNHHMFSCFLAWVNKTLVGLRLDEKENAYKKALISPVFVDSLDYCKGTYKTASGVYSVFWKKSDNKEISIELEIPDGASALLLLNGYSLSDSDCTEIELSSGKYTFIVKRRLK